MVTHGNLLKKDHVSIDAWGNGKVDLDGSEREVSNERFERGLMEFLIWRRINGPNKWDFKVAVDSEIGDKILNGRKNFGVKRSDALELGKFSWTPKFYSADPCEF